MNIMKKNILESPFKYADTLPTFEWSFDLSQQSFHCDNQINALLGFSKDINITLPQLLQKIDSRQIENIKSALNEAFRNKDNFTTRVILTGSVDRYLVDFKITSSSKISISGEIALLLPFPSLVQETELLSLLFKSGSRGYLLAAADHTILMVNNAFCESSGYTEGELIGQHASILKSGNYTKEFYTELWNKVDTNKLWHGELFARSKAGHIYTQNLVLERIELLDNSHFYFSSTRKIDVPLAALASTEEKNKFVSNVANKTNYTEQLQAAFSCLVPENTIVMATFSVKMLQKRDPSTENWLISQRFNSLSNKGVIGALNERVFSIFWIERKGIDNINKMLHQSMKELDGQNIDNDLSLSSILNIGISVLRIDAQSPDQLIKNSMQTSNANPILNESELFYFDARLSKRFDNRKILASKLKSAIDNKEITVLYQPIVSIPLMKTVGFEALVRFNLPTDIEYNTQTLIEIAEEYNWIDQLDHLVTNIALNDLTTIQTECKRQDLGMSINRSLVNDNLLKCSLEETISILESSHVDLHNITIELLETARFTDIKQQKEWIDKLQQAGAKIAIDDFGKGFSSFDYLDSFQIDYIKIARSFITGLTSNSRNYAMIESMTTLAHKIGAKVIAEGIENENELMLLSRANVDEVQGYLFAKPQPLSALIKDSGLPFPKHLKPLIHSEIISSVKNIAITTFATIEMDDRLLSAREKMVQTGISYLVVLEKSHYRGVIHEADICAALSPYLDTKAEQQRDILTLDKRVHQVMKHNLKTLHIDSPIRKAEHLLLDFPKAVIILFEKEGVCCGVTTIDELLRYNLKSKPVRAEHIEFDI